MDNHGGLTKLCPWVGKIPWRREWLPTLVFLPEELHGQRSLTGYSPCGHKELDTTEQLTLFTMIVKPILLLLEQYIFYDYLCDGKVVFSFQV